MLGFAGRKKKTPKNQIMLLHHSLDSEININLGQAKNSCVKHCDTLKTSQASFHLCVQT